jgi:hypothetical protein
MCPTEEGRAIAHKPVKKKTKAAKPAWEPTSREQLFPVVGGIAIAAVVTLILVVVCRKK